ncbi:MAG: type II toxin-antitoxin system VapC family toxin [Pirellulales bacterium]|nr:type II toxin-antitoxin system VapC family toxin [Pirellulales bacterium]
MGWVEDLDGKTVGLDTAPLVYYIEEHPLFGPRLDPFFEAVAAGRIRVVTSTVTLLEVLVLPLRQKDDALASKYNDILLSSEHVATVPVTPLIAQAAAELRATSKLKTPDAIQLATAIGHKAAAFLTGDRDFRDCRVTAILRVSELTA